MSIAASNPIASKDPTTSFAIPLAIVFNFYIHHSASRLDEPSPGSQRDVGYRRNSHEIPRSGPERVTRRLESLASWDPRASVRVALTHMRVGDEDALEDHLGLDATMAFCIFMPPCDRRPCQRMS